MEAETAFAAFLQGQKKLQKRGLPYAFGPLGSNAFFSSFVVVAAPLMPSRRASLEGPCSGAANFETAFAALLQGQKNLQKRGLPYAFGSFAAFVQSQKNPQKRGLPCFWTFGNDPGAPSQKGLFNKKRAQNNYKYMVWQAPGDDLGLNSQFWLAQI